MSVFPSCSLLAARGALQHKYLWMRQCLDWGVRTTGQLHCLSLGDTKHMGITYHSSDSMGRAQLKCSPKKAEAPSQQIFTAELHSLAPLCRILAARPRLWRAAVKAQLWKPLGSATQHGAALSTAWGVLAPSPQRQGQRAPALGELLCSCSVGTQ